MKDILIRFRNGEVDLEEVLAYLKELPYEDLGYAKLDHHREIRRGFPEVVFCQGKTTGQVVEIMTRLARRSENVLATRAEPEVYQAVKGALPEARYHDLARIIVLRRGESEGRLGPVAVVSAGTADLPVAEEAAVTAEAMGNRVIRIYDTGVAGLHRLLANRLVMNQARVIIVVAGMEGALASVVAGLVSQPVIAVPTSIGYGASFGGLAALLSMLNSCSGGIGVVNIDNGFGAAYLATSITRLIGPGANEAAAIESGHDAQGAGEGGTR